MGGSPFLFDCAYDEDAGEYPSANRLHRLGPHTVGGLNTGAWRNLADKGSFLGEIPVRHVEFDATRGAAIDDSVFASG